VTTSSTPSWPHDRSAPGVTGAGVAFHQAAVAATGNQTRPFEGEEVVRVSTAHDPAQQTIADRLLDSLDRLVRRHRSLALRGGEDTESHSALHVELIAAEVVQELAVARAWHRQLRTRRAS
jgi:hypothetical protein